MRWYIERFGKSETMDLMKPVCRCMLW